MKTEPLDALLATARGSFRSFSGGKDLPARVLARLTDEYRAAPFDPKITQRIRHAVDFLAAAQRHCDLGAHGRLHKDVANAQGDDLMMDGEHHILDAMEIARCLDLMTDRMPGVRKNMTDGLAAASIEPTEARQKALDVLRGLHYQMPEDLAMHRTDQAAYSTAARNMIETGRAAEMFLSAAPTPDINPLIARKQQRSNTALWFDLFRDMWMDALTTPQVPKTRSRLQHDFEQALKGAWFRVESNNFARLIDKDVGADFHFEFMRGRDLPVTEEETLKFKTELTQAESEIGMTARHLERDLRRFCLEARDMRTQFNHEDGQINPAMLATIIADTDAEGAYTQQVADNRSEASVTLLLDNSGSMSLKKKYLHATAAMKRLGDAHYRARLNFEMLGYTNVWVDRQTRTRFVVYKDYSMPWPVERKYLHAGLNTRHFGGTPEGQALWLAYKRTLMRPEANKLILIVNDGEPNDGALLKRVMDRIRDDGIVRIACVVLADKYTKDPSQYYGSNYIACNTPAELAHAIGNGISGLLFPKHGKKVFGRGLQVNAEKLAI